jgi:hypothetical protein
LPPRSAKTTPPGDASTASRKFSSTICFIVMLSDNFDMDDLHHGSVAIVTSLNDALLV